jgi:protein associated with RNAse G/E
VSERAGQPNRPLVIQKLLYDGSPSYRWAGQVLEQDEHCLLVVAIFQYDYRDLGYVVFERGDVFFEYYYFDRWYNVFQIYSRGGVLKGWYCNVTAPARVADGQLTFVDLALDLFVYPDRRFLVLDQDEFDQLADGTYRSEDVEAAKRALAELIDLAHAGRLPGRPFDSAIRPG